MEIPKTIELNPKKEGVLMGTLLKSEKTDLLFESSKTKSNAKPCMAVGENLSCENEVELPKEDPGRSSKKMRSLWEIHDCYHCSIIGTCLTISEQKKILTKEKISYKGFSLYDIHSTMLLNSREENCLSRRLNNLLNKKYSKEILEFSDCDERRFLSIWDERLKTGEISGPYWAAMSREDFTVNTRNRLFGDVHMLSHINGGEARGSLKEAVKVKEENDKLSKILKQGKEARREMTRRLTALEKSLAEMEGNYNRVIIENARLIEELTEINSDKHFDKLKTENTALKNLVSGSEDKLKNYEQIVESLKNERGKMVSNLSGLEETNNHLRDELNRSIQQFFSIYQQCDESCPAFNLCSKRILLVGGITRLRSLYRNLIEEKGGVFDYHDGYMRGGENILEEKIGHSDVVLCPVDVNSHNACLSVKRICKKSRRSYQMLPSSSLTSIGRALVDIVVKFEGQRQ